MPQIPENILRKIARILPLHYLDGPQDFENLACWNFALTGASDNGIDPQPMFDAIGIVGDALQDLSPAQKREFVIQAHQAIQAKHGDQAHAISQALKQIHTARHGGHIDNLEAGRRVMRKAIEHSGLHAYVTDEANPPYYIGMHWETNAGVSYNHWWIDIRVVREGGRIDYYTVETISSWHSLAIYLPPQRDISGNDRPGYQAVRFGLTELTQNHVDRITTAVNHAFHANHRMKKDVVLKQEDDWEGLT